MEPFIAVLAAIVLVFVIFFFFALVFRGFRVEALRVRGIRELASRWEFAFTERVRLPNEDTVTYQRDILEGRRGRRQWRVYTRVEVSTSVDVIGSRHSHRSSGTRRSESYSPWIEVVSEELNLPEFSIDPKRSFLDNLLLKVSFLSKDVVDFSEDPAFCKEFTVRGDPKIKSFLTDTARADLLALRPFVQWVRGKGHGIEFQRYSGRWNAKTLEALVIPLERFLSRLERERIQ
ncbi:MAG: hypothetical protein HC945_03720 [Nitrosarchaeum sp.]|nr:hypothetical protein [Nitrosarchaeum sp.]